MKTLNELSTFDLLLIAIAALFIWSLIRKMWSAIFKKKKLKIRKEYQARIFVNGQVHEYPKANIQKIKYHGRKYIAIKTADGSWDEYEGFPFILNVNKIDESPIV